MPAPLWRNRAFNLLWISQSLSDLGSSVSRLAIPLLVLVQTHSPVQAGLVGTAGLLVGLLCRLPAGVLIDRIDRRHAMVVCDVIRLVAYLALALALLRGRAGLPAIVTVAVLNAACGTVFSTAEHAALRNIVPTAQLPAAVARNEARTYGTSLAGPPVGGLLFGIGSALPFLGNCVTCLASLVGILLIRHPLQERRNTVPVGHASAMAEGVRFVFGNAFLRSVLLIVAPLNLAISGIMFAIIITLQRHHTPPAVIGTAETILGVGGLLGAFAAPALQRALRLPVLIRTICWTASGLMAVSALLTDSLAAAVPLGLAVFLGPACNAALIGYQTAITPDRLQGRVVSVIFLVGTSVSAAAPALAGLLIAVWGSATAVLAFAAMVVGSAIAATVGRGIRTMRPSAPA
jgi:MFS family permease